MLGSIIVQMPPTCRECRFFIQAFGYLCAGEENCTDEHKQWLRQNYAGKRPGRCPLKTESPSISGWEFVSPKEFHINDILSRIMSNLEFTEGYTDAHWYIYRSDTSLEDDLEELRNAMSEYIKGVK